MSEDPTGGAPTGFSALSPAGVGEIGPGVDLAALIIDLGVRDGDIVIVTSKVVSKAEGRVVAMDRDEAITAETVRVVARRGGTRIVENQLGLVMAAAGVDTSNVAAGQVGLLPVDPDDTARRLRATVRERTGATIAVVISDTAGRAWRHGQTDIAIGVAGILPLESFAGQVDDHGNELAVTAPAVADELASVAELASQKLGGRPITFVRGLADRVLADDDGPGARALVRERGADMFGLGSREAVLAALTGDQADAFGAPAEAHEFADALATLGIRTDAVTDDTVVVAVATPPADLVRASALAHAYGWVAGGAPERFVPRG